jgi:peptidoglycan/LPS O-acetylase OafA/YrhL
MGTLRLLLALAVAVGHSPFGSYGLQFVYPQVAVQAFFIISGFFITMVLNENKAYRSNLTFYASRYLRLYPVYIVCALATLALNKYNILSFKGYDCSYFGCLAFFRPTAKIFIMFSNMTIFFQDWFLFLQIHEPTAGLEFVKLFRVGTDPPLFTYMWVAQAWSLGIELVFYALAPFVVRSPIRIVGLICIALLSRYLSYLYIGQIADPWYYRFAISEQLYFGLGALSYHAWRALGDSPRARAIGAAAMFVLIVGTVFRKFFGLPQMFAGLMLVDPVFLALFALFIPAIFFFSRSNSWDRFVGELSYPFYLCHIGVGAALSVWTPPNIWVAHGAYFGLALLVSVALLIFIDLPVTRLRTRLFGAQGFRASVTATLQPRPAA